MDQDKPYFDGEPPKPGKAPSAPQIDAVGLRKAVSESLRPVLTAIPAQIADGVAKAMAGMPKEPTYTADPDKIAAAVGAEISKLKPPELNFELPDVFKLDKSTIEAISHNRETAEAIDKLGDRLKLIGKADTGASLRLLMQEMAKNPKLWLNVRFTDSKKFIDKLQETIVTSVGGPAIARENTLQSILAQLKTGIATTPGVGASTEAKQDVANTYLSSIDAKTPPIGYEQRIAGNVTISGSVTASGLQNIAAQKSVLLDSTNTPLTAGGSYTGPFKPVMGIYGALLVACVLNIPGFGGATRYSTLEIQFSSDGVTQNGHSVTLTPGLSDNVNSLVTVSPADNFARIKLTEVGGYDWVAAGGTIRVTFVGLPVGAGSFIRSLGTTIVEGNTGSGSSASPVTIGGDDGSGNSITLIVDTNGNARVVGNATTITGGYVVTAERGGTTGTLTNVTAAASSTQLAASASGRRGFRVFNDTPNNLYLKFGTSVSTTSFTEKIPPGASFNMPLPLYTGAVTGISDGDVSGTWRVTTW